MTLSAPRPANPLRESPLPTAVEKGKGRPPGLGLVAEVAAVLSRLSPETASDDAPDLCALELATEGDLAACAEAVRLAGWLPHCLFDTLYHAVALTTPNARLPIAGQRYYAEAEPHGAVVWLRDGQRGCSRRGGERPRSPLPRRACAARGRAARVISTGLRDRLDSAKGAG